MRSSFLHALFGIGLVVLGQPFAARADSPSKQLSQLLADAWEFELREDPLWATEVGDHRYDDKLPQVSLEDEARRAKAQEEFLTRLERIDRAALPPGEQVSYDVFRRRVREELREFEFKSYLMPISDRYGFHVEFPELARTTPLSTTEDFENFIARLRAFDHYVAGNIELMRQGLKEGMTVPSDIMQRYAEPLEAQIVSDPEKSLLYVPFRDLPAAVPPAEHDRLRAAARAAIADSVVPGYRRFLNFMRDEYVPGCRGSIAASALPHGRDYYRFCISKFTTLDDVTPHEIHAIGMREVGRIRQEMDEAIKKTGFDGDFAAFTEHLRNEARFYAKTPEELEKEAALILKRMDGHLPELFGRLPRTPYGIRRIPDFIAPQATAAYYMPSTGDGRRAGFMYLNTFNLRSRPLYMLESLALHEAVPGHHLQLALQKELESLPNFRKFARDGGTTAFVEGWALYSERLGLECGFYTDPYSNFGRLTMEMWRACRLVVDTGMHYLGWTRNQAVDFMRDNSAMPLHDIRAEVDRYIGWPGQALAYKIGELKIRELREAAERELKAGFDLREFHDVVLGSGAVPLDVLDANVRAWIKEKAQPATAPAGR